jgi:hypothetical protein
MPAVPARRAVRDPGTSCESERVTAMAIRSTYTYAVLDVSAAVYDEIRAKLEMAGYEHAFHEDDGKVVIDMHGIALSREE